MRCYLLLMMEIKVKACTLVPLTHLINTKSVFKIHNYVNDKLNQLFVESLTIPSYLLGFGFNLENRLIKVHIV